MHQQDGVRAAVADIAPSGQLGLLVRRETLAAVGADQKPVGSAAGRGTIRVVLERIDMM
ncbi:Uncharacterised protein [Mycobacteroides abscessus subsp. abscessus]|nr:Uncharacterised protein [Mycobacteroides abscessus subsp. abscessus]SKW13292.1 Uncharacterised protein [Mycobacteroides abscessus subsp. abscessus]